MVPYQEISLPRTSSRKNCQQNSAEKCSAQNFFEEKLLPKNLLYQNFVWKRNFHPKKFLLDKTSTKEYLQKHLYQKVSENKNLAKQIKRHLHQVFSQEKCLAKNLWEEMFTKKCLDIIYQTLSGDTPYQRVLEDKFPTKNSEEKSPPKQFWKKPLPKRFCSFFFRYYLEEISLQIFFCLRKFLFRICWRFWESLVDISWEMFWVEISCGKGFSINFIYIMENHCLLLMKMERLTPLIYHRKDRIYR